MKTPQKPDKPKKTKSRLGKLTLQKDIFDTALKDDLKTKVDIVSLFSHFGVQLTKKGKSYTGLCPWHDDKNPSLSVDKEKGLYNCFGCGESGDVFSLVEKMKGLSFSDAMKYLQQFTGSTYRPDAPAKPEQQAVQMPKDEKSPHTPLKKGESSTLTVNDVSNYYTKKLIESKTAQDYLKSRGITNEAITYFNIGYSDGTLKEKVGKDGFEQLQKKGLFSEKGYELFSNCVVVPLTDIDSQVFSFYGRNINAQAKIQHVYPAGEHKAVFHEKAFKVYDQIILTESVIDALSLFSVGVQNVSCIYGTQGLTKLHVSKLHEHSVREVVLALDNDEAGKAATEKYTELLINEGFSVKVIFPVAKDWNDDLVSGKLNKEAILEQIEKAEEQKQENGGRSFRRSDVGLTLKYDDLTYTVKSESQGYKQSIKCEVSGETFYDRVDLYSSRSRTSFANNISRLFDIPSKQIEKDLITLLEFLEDEKENHAKDETDEIILSESDKELGLNFLTNPNMFDEIVKDTETLGYVGEETNKKLMYLAASSVKLDDPISILILSESGSGKSFLVDTVKKLIPGESIIDATSLSDQALNYVGDLEHKFLILSEAVHKDVVEHQLREMVSAKKLSRLVTKKDDKTGKMRTEQVTTKAVVSVVMSSTNYNVNPENASRCFVLYADESREQTQRIHTAQREKYSLSRHKVKMDSVPEIVRKHVSAQRLLKKYAIVNEFNRHLDFPDSMMRARRDHERFIDLIAVVCHVRQYQKEVKQGDGFLYIECDLKDYEIAREIMVSGVLSSSMVELPQGALILYESFREYAKQKADKAGLGPTEITLCQRELREYGSFSNTYTKTHLRTLVEYEYVVKSGGKYRGSRSYYRLNGDDSLQSLSYHIPTVKEIKNKLQQSENE